MRYWNEEDTQFLYDNYIEKGAKFCAERLGRSTDQIYDKVKRIRLIRRPKYEQIRPRNDNLKILISWEELDKKAYTDLIPFNCSSCGNLSSKTKQLICQSVRKNFSGIYCSLECVNNLQKQEFFQNLPSVELIKSLINQDLTMVQIAKSLKKCPDYVERLFKLYNLETVYKKAGICQHPKTKAKISAASKEYMKNHPNPRFKEIFKGKGLSPICEKVKEELTKRKIPFQAEVSALLHLGLRYRADIVFEEYGVIWELNGLQHYNEKGYLTPYYRNRHKSFVDAGWKVFEIPIKDAMKPDFLDNMLSQTYEAKNKPSPEYKLYISKNICPCCSKRVTVKIKACLECRLNCNDCPVTKEQLHYLIWNYKYAEIRKMFGVAEPRLNKWIRHMNFKETPTDGYRTCIRHGFTTDYQI